MEQKYITVLHYNKHSLTEQRCKIVNVSEFDNEIIIIHRSIFKVFDLKTGVCKKDSKLKACLDTISTSGDSILTPKPKRPMKRLQSQLQ